MFARAPLTVETCELYEFVTRIPKESNCALMIALYPVQAACMPRRRRCFIPTAATKVGD
jgi:hypothetical protein